MASPKELVETELLLLQHRRGVPDALEKLVALWERPLYYYVRRLVNTEEEAKDVTQEVWLTVVRKVRTVRDPAAFPAWLYRVARSRVFSYFRTTPAFTPLPAEEDHAVQGFADGAGHLPAMNAEELHWGLGQLNPLHSECLILHYLEGFSLEEISGIVSVPVGTVKSRMHYAKKALRELLREEASGDGSE